MGLTDYITSDYVRASNALNGKSARRKIVAYVESYDDVYFWRSILSQLEDDKRYFQVTLPSRGHKLERGKKAVLMSAFKYGVGPDMIACVDADYDYLKQGSNGMSDTVCHNSYVFHTYAYAIENLQCWAPSLKETCVMATLVDSPDIMNFEEFFSRYSVIIYPLFVWNILCARNPSFGDFGIQDMIATTQTGIVEKKHEEETLRHVKEKVSRKLQQIQAVASTKAKQAYKKLYDELPTLGVKPEETYMFIQGHSLFDNLVVPMLSHICQRLERQREQEIRQQSKHDTQYRNEMTCYEHSLADVAAMLKKNNLYLRSPYVARIYKDLKDRLQ